MRNITLIVENVGAALTQGRAASAPAAEDWGQFVFFNLQFPLPPPRHPCRPEIRGCKRRSCTLLVLSSARPDAFRMLRDEKGCCHPLDTGRTVLRSRPIARNAMTAQNAIMKQRRVKCRVAARLDRSSRDEAPYSSASGRPLGGTSELSQVGCRVQMSVVPRSCGRHPTSIPFGPLFALQPQQPNPT
jgi:hypothetical protein